VGGTPINHVLWKHDADTDSWTNYSEHLPPRGTFGTFASQRGYDLLVEVHPTNSDLVYAGGVNLWGVDVGGPPEDAASWIGGYNVQGRPTLYEGRDGAPQHPDQHAIAFHPTKPDVMLTGSDGGVHRTDDNQAVGEDGGVAYTSLNNGYFTTQFYHVCMGSDPQDPTIMGGMQDNGTWFTQSADPTTPWSREQGGDGAECEIVYSEEADATFRYASTQGGRITQRRYEVGRRGRTKQAYPENAGGRFFVHPFEVDPADPSTMYYPAGDSIYRNTNLRTQPTEAWQQLSASLPSGYTVTTLEASTTNDAHVLYYGATDADGDNTSEVARLYRAEDARGAFGPAEVTGSSFPDGAFPSDIAVDPRSSDSVLVAFSNYGVTSLFHSTDGGETWTDVEGNLGASSSGPSVRSVAILPQPGKDQTTYYVATSVGLYSTTSLGRSTTWRRESPNGIGNVVVNDVETRLSDGQVVAGTHANGVYSTNLPVPAEIADFETATNADARGVTLTWRISRALSPRIELEHRYRDRPYDDQAVLEKTSPRTYRYRVDSLPAGPHTFRVRQIEGPSTARTLETADVVVPTEGAYDLTPPAPNPFRRTTTMRLTVKKQQPVRATLYNTLGQRVATVLDETLGANRPVDLRVSGDGLASGVYFLRVRGNEFEVTRKIVLVE
jgi:hypothetical protein